jgi:hypothetical protein
MGVAMRLCAALCLMCFAASAFGQDPRAIAVQAAARSWLALVDRGDAQGAWKAAGKKFQTTLSADAWAAELNRAQDQMGKAVQRTVGPARFQSSFSGLPDGDYAQILFRTSFAKRPNGSEQLTLEREADGLWRVVGYFPR